MSTYTVASGRFSHPVYGTVRVRTHSTTRHISARWECSELVVVVPRNIPYDDFIRFIDDREIQRKLLARKPAARLEPGRLIEGTFCDFFLRYGTPDRAGTLSSVREERSPSGRDMMVVVLSDNVRLQATTEAVMQTFLNNVLTQAATAAAWKYLLPHAAGLAARIGREPQRWDVKNTRRALGQCCSDGTIYLSPKVVFLPEELADYIVYHELAHLSEMNHSAAFHRLCDAYCGGREAEFVARVRAFDFPIR